MDLHKGGPQFKAAIITIIIIESYNVRSTVEHSQFATLLLLNAVFITNAITQCDDCY